MSQSPDEKTQKLGEALARLRDGLQSLQPAVEAIDAYLSSLGQRIEERLTWNPNKIKWVQETGAKGPYERYPAKDQKAESTEDYRNMLQDLKDHKSAMNQEGYFYWVFPDASTVGRRKKG